MSSNHQLQAELLIDTNVFIDIVDILEAENEARKAAGLDESTPIDQLSDAQRNAILAEETVQYRMRRLRGSLLVFSKLAFDSNSPAGICLHEVRQRLEGMICNADTKYYTWMNLTFNYVYRKVWENPCGEIVDFNTSLQYEEVDNELLRIAEEDELIIISNEGWRKTGIPPLANQKRSSLRYKNPQRVCTSEEWVKEHVDDPEALSRQFLQKFTTDAQSFLDVRQQEFGDGTVVCGWLDAMRNVFELALTLEITNQ